MKNMFVALILGSLAAASPARPLPIPRAIFTDPIHDGTHPAAMQVLHIPTGGVAINAVAYLAAGGTPHPTLVLMHGLPGNEKNLDLAQAVRRAGWNVITFNYRGSWGSPGRFAFANTLEDARAVLAYVRSPEVAKKLGVDVRNIVIGGHSMGGWVAAMTAEEDPEIAGTILISAANMGSDFGETHQQALEGMAQNMETLANTSPGQMVEELERHRAIFNWTAHAAGLAKRPLLILTSDDGLAPASDALAATVRGAARRGAAGRVTLVHVATDHGWSDRRIRLQGEVIRWLQALRQ